MQRGHNNRLDPTVCGHSHSTPGSGRKTGRVNDPEGKGMCVYECVCVSLSVQVCVRVHVCVEGTLVVLLRSC